MCSGKANAVSTQIVAVVFMALAALLAIGSASGPYILYSCGSTTASLGLASITYSNVYGKSGTAAYSAVTATSADLPCSITSCPVFTFASSNGGAAIALFVIGIICSFVSIAFMVLRVIRLRKGQPLPAGPRSCHSRGCTTITLNTFAFSLNLIGSILGWISILPLAVAVFGDRVYAGQLCIPAGGAGSTIAGINIVISFIGFLCDACSHCCCKSIKNLGTGPTTTVVVMAPGAAPAYPMSQHVFGSPMGAPAMPPPPSSMLPPASQWRRLGNGKDVCALRRARASSPFARPSPHPTRTLYPLFCRVRKRPDL